MKRLFRNFWEDQSGATAIEYGLIAAGHRSCNYRDRQRARTNLNTKYTAINNSLK
jgi:pilus assembly protein Flp/PilA